MIVEHARQEIPRVRVRVSRDLLRRSRGDDPPALRPAFRTEVYDPVGGLNDVEVVLDDQNRCPAVNQLAERGEELLNVVEVKTGCGFVEDIQDTLVCLRGEMRGKLQALRLAAGKCRRGLPQAQVAQTHLFENSQLRSDLWNSRKKCQSLANRELQHLMNVLFPVAHFEHAAFKARPAAFFADQFDVRQELHFYRHDAFALACFAAAAGNVERKMSG